MFPKQRAERISSGSIALVGVPWDEHSSFLRGAAEAPGRIRAALFSSSTNLSTEAGLDLGHEPRLVDAGDIEAGSGPAAAGNIERAAGVLLSRGAHLLALGGDHAVTYPLLRAHARAGARLSVLHLDAHPDLYQDFEGDPLSHASPFARIMEEGLAARLVQVGVRTLNQPQRTMAERFGVEIIEMKDWQGKDWQGAVPVLEGDVYLSLDLDVLDPAFAPGVAHNEPGGLSTREVIAIVQRFRGRLVGADIVELNPQRDPLGITAMAAAKLLKELAGRMLADNP
jgi:arginase